MLVKIKKKSVSEEEVEINFPIFKREEATTYTSMSCIQEKPELLSEKTKYQKIEVTLYKKSNDFAILSHDCIPEVWLRDGEYGNGTREQFEELLKEATSRSTALSNIYHWRSPEKISELEKAFAPGTLIVQIDPPQNEDL